MSETRTLGGEPPGWKKWATLAILSLTLFISAVDLLIVNTALRTIAVDLNTGIDQLAWVVSAFMLALGSWPLVAGAIGDRVGRKRLILVGLTLFGGASLLATTANDAPTLIVARYLMGAGVGLVMPNAVATMRGMFEGPQLARALAVWAASAGLGLVTGPLAGGLLLQQFSWGSVFLVNVPVAVVALVAGAVLIPETRQAQRRRLDWPGMALSVPAFSLLVWALLEAPDQGWTSSTIIGALAAFVTLGVAWVVWEHRAREPMVELEWFRRGGVAGAVVALACAYGALVGSLFLMTIWLQVVQGFDPLETGVRLLPVAATLLVSVPVAVAVGERRGHRWVIAAGLGLIAVWVGLLAQTTADTGYLRIAVGLCLAGAGLGATLAPAQHLIVESLPARFSAVGTSLGDTGRYVGAAVGLAVSASLFSSQYRDGIEPTLHDPRLSRLPSAAVEAAHDSIVGATTVADRIDGPIGAVIRDAALSDGFVAGIHTAGLVATGIAVLGALLAAKLIPAGKVIAASVSVTAEPGIASSSVAAASELAFSYTNRPGEVVVTADLSGSRFDTAGVTGALVRAVSTLTSAGTAVERVLVCVAQHINPHDPGRWTGVDAAMLSRIRGVALAVKGIADVGEPVVDYVDGRGWRAVITAVPQAGTGERAFEACAKAVAKAAPELAEVLVCREIALRTA